MAAESQFRPHLLVVAETDSPDACAFRRDAAAE